MRGELAKLPLHTPQDEQMYDYWIVSEKKLLPFSGGFMEQPARVMSMLKLIDYKYRIEEKIAEIREKQDESVNRAMKALERIPQNND